MKRSSARTVLWLTAVGFLLLNLQIVTANIYAGKIFAGHDPGFYFYFPSRLLYFAQNVWDSKDAFGYPDFVAPAALFPAAINWLIVNLSHMGSPAVGRFYYFLALAMLEGGAFWLSWTLLARSRTPLLQRCAISAAAAFAAAFNPYAALLLTQPVNPFQLGIFIWPLIVAYEIDMLWRRESYLRAFGFAILLALATMGNTAHLILGILLVVAVYIILCSKQQSWRLRSAGFVFATFIGGTAHIWMPSLVTSSLLHGSVIVREVLPSDPDAIFRAQTLESSRASIAALLRLDGANFFPDMPSADIYLLPFMKLIAYVPALIGLFALFRRTGLYLWLFIVLAIEFAKSVHGPVALNVPWLTLHVPGYHAYRESYDKFGMYLLIAIPAVFALGLAELVKLGRSGRATAVAAGLAMIVLAGPFVLGRVAEPTYQTTIPAEYYSVDKLLGNSPDTRVLTLPGSYLDNTALTWFKGANFEDLFFHVNVVNGELISQRSISTAPIYNDEQFQQARDLPYVVSLLPQYGIQYILVHKDMMASFSAADPNTKTEGPLLSAADESVLDRDPRAQAIFRGRYLVLYRLRVPVERAIVGDRPTGIVGYENTTLGALREALLPGGKPFFTVYSGNQSTPLLARSLFRSADRTIVAPIYPESPALYAEQVALPAQLAAKPLYDVRPIPYAYLLQPVRGDFISPVPSDRNIAAGVHILKPTSAALHISALAPIERTESAALFFGSARSLEPAVAPIAQYSAFDHLVDYQAASVHERSTLAPVIVRKTGGFLSYDLHFSSVPKDSEGIELRMPVAPLALRGDPQITLFYAMDPSGAQQAWLRMYLRGPDGRVKLLDHDLDASGLLDKYDPRDVLQEKLNEEFSREVTSHRSDAAWARRQESINPPQADDFTLASVAVVVQKTDALDASQGAFARFDLVGLEAESLDPLRPSYDYVHTYMNFARSEGAGRWTGPPGTVDVSKSSSGQFFSVGFNKNAVARNRPARIGDNVVFYLQDGTAVNGTLTSINADGWVVTTSTGDQTLSKVNVKTFMPVLPSIANMRPTYTMSYRLAVPERVSSAPLLRFRYWLGSSDEALTIHLGMNVGGRTVDVVPGLRLQPELPVQLTPPAWTSLSLFANDDPFAATSSLSGGWHQVSFDLRPVAAYRAGGVDALLTSVRFEFRMDASSRPFGTSQFRFGLGDLMLASRTTNVALNVIPSGADFDGNLMLARAKVFAREGRLDLTFPRRAFAAGNHRFMSLLPPPWQFESGSIVDTAYGTVPAGDTFARLVPIGADLYGVHLAASAKTNFIFLNTFHPGWRLYRVSSLPSNRFSWLTSLRWMSGSEFDGAHFTADAFANAWQMRVPSGGWYVLDFVPENLEAVGIFVALLTLILALGLAIGTETLRERR